MLTDVRRIIFIAINAIVTLLSFSLKELLRYIPRNLQCRYPQTIFVFTAVFKDLFRGSYIYLAIDLREPNTSL